jgi:large subunit ribosomal protein L25
MHPDNAVIVAVKMSRNAMKGGAAAMDDEDEEMAEEVKDQSPLVPTTEEKSEE